MRRLNVRLLVISLAILVVTALVVHGIHLLQVRRQLPALLEQADNALELGKVARAEDFLNRYFDYRPADDQARIKYGVDIAKDATTVDQFAFAARLLEPVLWRNPDEEVRRQMVRVNIALSRLDEAVKQIKKLLPESSDKDQLQYLLGWCQAQSGNYSDAVESLRAAIRYDPKRLTSYTLLATILQDRLEQHNDADRIIEQMVEANPKSYRAYLIRADWRTKRGLAAEARQDIDKALSLAPGKAEVLVAAATQAEAEGELQKAHDYLDSALEIRPASVALHQRKARLLDRLGKRQKAIDSLRASVAGLKRPPSLVVLLADLLIDEGKSSEARKLVDRLRQAALAPGVLDYLDGRLAYSKKAWSRATRLLERSLARLDRKSSLRAPANVVLGLCYQQEGERQKQLEAFKRAVADEPSWTSARVGLAAALLDNGRVEEAATVLQNARQAPDAPGSLWLVLGRALVAKNLSLPKEQRDWSGVRDALHQAGKDPKLGEQVALLRAEMLSAQNQNDSSRTTLTQSLSQHRESVQLWAALSDLALRQRRYDESERLLNKAIDVCGDQVDLRLAKARLYASQPGSQSKLASLVDDLDDFSDEEKTRLMRGLADLDSRLGRSAEAMRLWSKLAERDPNDAVSRLRLFEAALALGKVEQARDYLQQLRDLDKAFYHFGQAAFALRLAGEGDEEALRQARIFIDRLEKERPEWSHVPLLQARLAEANDDLDQAIAKYLVAVERGERTPPMIFRLATLLRQRGRLIEADRVLRKIDEESLRGPFARLGAEVALRTRDLGRAARLARKAVPKKTRDYRQLLWLAHILEVTGNSRAAERALRQAVDVAGHATDAWVALVKHLVRSGQEKKAEQTVDLARKRLPSRQSGVARARLAEAVGDLKQAELLFRSALRDHPDDVTALYQASKFFHRTEQPDKARSLLEKLIDPAHRVPGELVTWARRQLAADLGSSDDPAARRRAFRLLDHNDLTPGHRLADQRTRAYVLGFDPKKRDEAIRLFEGTLDKGTLSNQEQLWLAQLYEKANRPDKARLAMAELLAAQRNNPRYLAASIRYLLRRDEVLDAKHALQQLQRLEPDSQRTRRLREQIERAETELRKKAL